MALSNAAVAEYKNYVKSQQYEVLPIVIHFVTVFGCRAPVLTSLS
jgi:hypothetical protein